MQLCLKIKVLDQQFDLANLYKKLAKEIQELLGSIRFVPLKEFKDNQIGIDKVDIDVSV